MDPAGVGALIGFASLCGCFLLVFCNDILQKRRQNNIAITTPLLATQPTPVLIKKRSHWRFHSLHLPEPIPVQTIYLSSLSSTTSISSFSTTTI